MMDLQCTRDKNEEVFDDTFRNCRKHIVRVDELHSDPENDGTYVIIVWATRDIEKQLNENMTAIHEELHSIGKPFNIIKLDEWLYAVVEHVY